MRGRRGAHCGVKACVQSENSADNLQRLFQQLFVSGQPARYDSMFSTFVPPPIPASQQIAPIVTDTYRLQKSARPQEAIPAASTTSAGQVPLPAPPKRLVSLDAYRGFIMTMLAASGFGIFRLAQLKPDNSVWQIWDYETFQRLKPHFTHPPWESITGWCGVSFWDLIQPSFMFMVGVAMPFSYARRGAMGSSNMRRLFHAVFRAIVLTLMGVFLASQNSVTTNWVFTNVLAQIGLGYVFAYLLLGRSMSVQLVALVMILVSYWGFFVWTPPPADYDYAAVDASHEDGEIYDGDFAPWSKNANAGHFFDEWFLNLLRAPAASSDTGADDSDEAGNDVTPDIAAAERSLLSQWLFSNPERYTHSRGGYVTLNFIPSIATTLLGILCGQLLLGGDSAGRKLGTLILAGAICFSLGILAHHSVCPIVKRIWTPSWVLFSGGYVMWMLAAFYLVFDVLPLRLLAFPLVVVGMNSIVMYMLGQLLRPWVSQHVVQTHFAGLLSAFYGDGCLQPDGIGAVLVPSATFVVFWLIAFWMYRNRYFVRV